MSPGSSGASGRGTEDRGYGIHGRVQGVAFRWWTRGVAEKVGIVGTVKNRSDGSVEVMARGSVDALARFETALRKGPALARVDRVVPVECTLPDSIDTFTIDP